MKCSLPPTPSPANPPPPPTNPLCNQRQGGQGRIDDITSKGLRTAVALSTASCCVHNDSFPCHCDCKWVSTPFHTWNVIKVGASCTGARGVEWGSEVIAKMLLTVNHVLKRRKTSGPTCDVGRTVETPRTHLSVCAACSAVTITSPLGHASRTAFTYDLLHHVPAYV